jgi:hypothetical protein
MWPEARGRLPAPHGEQARCALAELDRVAGELSAGRAGGASPGGALAIHLAFLQLYRLATRHWLRFAAGSPHAAALDELIVVFHRLYRGRVVARLLPTSEAAAAGPGSSPWEACFRLARRAERAPRAWWHGLGLWRGVRAHSRHDLAEALVRTYRRGGRSAPLPDLEVLSTVLRGSECRRLLRRVARAATRAMTWRRGASRRRLAALACRLGEPLWLGVLQHWRRAALREAASRLAAESPHTSSSLSALATAPERERTWSLR